MARIESPTPTVWTVGARHKGWRLDRFLQEQIPKLSRTHIQKAIRERIKLSWRTNAAASTKMVVGEKVTASFPPIEQGETIDYTFSVLYEDPDFLAVDKPTGMVVHPTNRLWGNSLIEILRRQRANEDLRLVHRLDRETSGVLLIAKNSAAARTAGKALMAKGFQKTYIARVKGGLPKEQDVIDAPIGRHLTSRIKIRRAVVPSGETAVTRYRVLQSEGEASLVELKLETGRTHQLRVHCEALGCPILGDPLYGHPDEHYLTYITEGLPPERLQLHAWKLCGQAGNKNISLEAPLPEIFRLPSHL